MLEKPKLSATTLAQLPSKLGHVGNDPVSKARVFVLFNLTRSMSRVLFKPSEELKNQANPLTHHLEDATFLSTKLSKIVSLLRSVPEVWIIKVLAQITVS